MKHRTNYGDTTGCAVMIMVAPLLFIILGSAMAAQKYAESKSPAIVEVLLYNKAGVPAGYVDSTTRTDATDLCNKLIASQSKAYGNSVSKSRCIIRLQE